MTPEEQKLVDESFTHMDLESKDLVAERIEQLNSFSLRSRSRAMVPSTSIS